MQKKRLAHTLVLAAAAAFLGVSIALSYIVSNYNFEQLQLIEKKVQNDIVEPEGLNVIGEGTAYTQAISFGDVESPILTTPANGTFANGFTYLLSDDEKGMKMDFAVENIERFDETVTPRYKLFYTSIDVTGEVDDSINCD